jgi:alkylated DNA repair protein (DNA oxidative demethylase)
MPNKNGLGDDLLANLAAPGGERVALGSDAVLLTGFARDAAPDLLSGLETVLAASPFRHMVTPGGHRMSVAMTSAGPLGWVTDRRGYRYEPCDPETGRPWPPLPASFASLATQAAKAAGFPGFVPDSCLINRYAPASQLALHQDRNERDFSQPIVSVSLGLPAIFLFGGPVRGARPRRVRLAHGDVVVWGGTARLHFHGVAPLAEGTHPLTGRCRINLTFRRAG